MRKLNIVLAIASAVVMSSVMARTPFQQQGTGTRDAAIGATPQALQTLQTAGRVHGNPVIFNEGPMIIQFPSDPASVVRRNIETMRPMPLIMNDG